MPSRIMYANRHGDEISDHLEDFLDDSDTALTNSEDDTYVTGTDNDASSVSDDETTSTSNNGDDDPLADHDLPDPETPDHAAPLPPGDEEDVLEDDDGAPPPGDEQDVLEDDDSEPPPADGNEDHIPIPDATHGPAAVTDGCQDDDSSATMLLEPHRLNMAGSRPPKKPVMLRVTYKSAGDMFPRKKRPPPTTWLSSISLSTS